MVAVEVDVASCHIDAPRELLLLVGVPCGPKDEDYLLVAGYTREENAELGILFLYFASPTAAASFVMARAVNSNHQLAATIIVITTLMAALSINAGLFVLGWLGWT